MDFSDRCWLRKRRWRRTRCTSSPWRTASTPTRPRSGRAWSTRRDQPRPSGSTCSQEEDRTWRSRPSVSWHSSKSLTTSHSVIFHFLLQTNFCPNQHDSNDVSWGPLLESFQVATNCLVCLLLNLVSLEFQAPTLPVLTPFYTLPRFWLELTPWMLQ